MNTNHVVLALAVTAACLLATAVPAQADNRLLHLSIGDPARKDREAPLVLDAVTDTATDETITPGELARRLQGVNLLLVGEEHTNMEFHRVQARVIEALAASGRRVLIGLEMYPYTEQRFLDQWRDGLLTEEGFLRLSRWYENWGYHWHYYRRIFLHARDHGIPMFAVNTPREVVAAVRKKGFDKLTPEEARHIPTSVDVDSEEHLTFFKASIGPEAMGGALHGGGSDEMWKSMLAAQATWDATMGFNAVEALKSVNDPNAIMVVLVGSGHVAYGLGIERQASRWFDGKIATLIPVPVSDPDDGENKTVRASYANFVWGVPAESDTDFPRLPLSTGPAKEGAGRQIIQIDKGSTAERAGFKVGDVIVSMDGTPIPDRETLNRLLADKQWGDEATFVVRRGTEQATLTVQFRRSAPAASKPAPKTGAMKPPAKK